MLADSIPCFASCLAQGMQSPDVATSPRFAARARSVCVQAEDESDATYAIERLAERSVDDELGATIDHDLMLLNIAIVGVGLYTFVALSRLRDGFIGMRLTLTVRGTSSQRSERCPSTIVTVRANLSIVSGAC
jgi:hypothetical protein